MTVNVVYKYVIVIEYKGHFENGYAGLSRRDLGEQVGSIQIVYSDNAVIADTVKVMRKVGK